MDKISFESLSINHRKAKITQQERVYQTLREAIMSGLFRPGRSVTLRGLAEMLNVSPMPVREAIRRLTAERGLELLDNRRIAVPRMTDQKLKEISDTRIALECLCAERALPFINALDHARLMAIDQQVNAAIQNNNKEEYIRKNYEFHATLYGFGRSQVALPLISTLWLQIAPFMRLVFDGIDLWGATDNHMLALEAILDRDAGALKAAIKADILEGYQTLSAADLEALADK